MNNMNMVCVTQEKVFVFEVMFVYEQHACVGMLPTS